MKANQQLQKAITEFNGGNWKEAYDTFVDSMVLATTSAEQILGAALAAYNSEDYQVALEYARQMNGYRAEAVDELKARCYLHINDLKWKDINFLTSVSERLKTGLKHDLAQTVIRWWLKAPTIHEQIESLITQVCRERPRVIDYHVAMARYRVLQGRTDEALAACASISDGDHTEASLGIYSEILRERGDRSSIAFACLKRFWTARPDHVDNALYLVKLCLEIKDVGFAEAIIRQGLTMAPEEPRLRYHLALVLRMAGRTQECLAELQELLRTPDTATYRSHDELRLLMAKCLMESNMYDPAIRQLQGMARTSAVLDLLYELGTRYSAVGKHEKSRECWEDIYAVDVRYKDVFSRIQSSPTSVARSESVALSNVGPKHY